MWVGFSNPTFQSFPNFLNVWTSAFFVGYQYPTYVETEQYMWIGFLNPTFQPFPNFRNVWTSAFLSDTSIRPTSKPKNPCGSDSRIRHFNHSRIFAMCGHRLFCRIQVSNLRRNLKIHVGRILESDISIISEFSQYMDIGSFVGYKYPTYVETEQSM